MNDSLTLKHVAKSIMDLSLMMRRSNVTGHHRMRPQVECRDFLIKHCFTNHSGVCIPSSIYLRLFAVCLLLAKYIC